MPPLTPSEFNDAGLAPATPPRKAYVVAAIMVIVAATLSVASFIFVLSVNNRVITLHAALTQAVDQLNKNTGNIDAIIHHLSGGQPPAPPQQ